VRGTGGVDIRSDDLTLVVDAQSLHRYGVARAVQPDDLAALLDEADIVAARTHHGSGDIAFVVDGGGRRAGEPSDVHLGESVLVDVVGEAMVVPGAVCPEANCLLVVVDAQKLLHRHAA
jgi:hypothetical protein